MWEAYIDAWQAQFAELMKERRAPGFAEELLLLIANEDYGEPLNTTYEANEALSREALAAVFASLSKRQNEHLEDRLGGLAQDFRELAAQAPRYEPEPRRARHGEAAHAD